MIPGGVRAQCAYGLAAGVAACAVLLSGAAATAPDGISPGLRIAVSENVAGQVNGNDLRAAIRTWAQAVARQTGVRIEPEICTTQQLLQRVRNRQVDAFSLNILEFERVAAYADHELVLDSLQLPDGDEYLLLVHRSGGILSLGDLHGRSLLLYWNPRTCLARVWLDTLLASAHLEAAETFLGRIESNAKLSSVVLPVFFRQTDACLITKRGYRTLCELNPQLAAQLRPLATSPGFITAFLVFHKDSAPEMRHRFLQAITDLHKTIEGQQALMLFGGTHLVRADLSVLHSSLELLRTYEKLKGKPPAGGQ